MIFLTLDGEHIDLQNADRIHVGWRIIDARKCWVVFVNIGRRQHTLVSTGDDRRQAEFHRDAIIQCQGNGGI